MVLTPTHFSNCKFEICENSVKIQQADSIKCFSVIIGNKLMETAS